MRKCDVHLNPGPMPMSLTERVAHLEKETGIKMSEEEFLEFKRYGEGSLIKGQDHVFQGHQNTLGWGVPINYTQAARHYAKAAKLKNVEGMYNLAICYHIGRGMEQNVEEALRMYRQVAEMDPDTPGELTPLKRNLSVAGAQHSIGLLFEDGIGLEQNYSEAAKWYKRAMENGLGNSANNLGILYFRGQGVPQDMKMVEFCWKQAIALKDANAAPALMTYYMNELEPVTAEDIFRIGREMGNQALLNLPEKKFNEMLQLTTSSRSTTEPKVLEFESAQQLSKKGLTFRERLYRKEHYKKPHLEKLNTPHLDKLLKNLLTNDSGAPRVLPLGKENILALKAKANSGSVTAHNVLKTLEYSCALNALLDQTQPNTATEQRKSEIIDLFYPCATGELHLVGMFEWNDRKLKTLLEKLFKEKCNTTGDDEMRIRFCFVKWNLGRSMHSRDMYAVELLLEGIRRYPNNLHYYQLITDFLGEKGKFKMGKVYAEKGLQLFPDDADLLYSLAVNLRQMLGEKDEPDECIAKYKEFLAKAPYDHRKVPEAFYQIAAVYCGRLRSRPNFLTTIESNYQRGLDAEKHQLPCYLPYGPSNVKRLVETTISIFKFKKLLRSPHVENPASAEVDKSVGKILEQKPYLKSPSRKGVINLYRKGLRERFDDDEECRKAQLLSQLLVGATVSPKLQQPRFNKAAALRPITLLGMNPMQDCIYQDRRLELTIMDDPNTYYPSIHFIAEDENGDITRVYIYNVEKTEKSMQNFRPGCRIAIMNPYMRIGADGTSGIRNDEPSNIVYLHKVESMCRFCGEENALRKCAKCKRPYCSRECQRLDWKMFNHKLICDLKISMEEFTRSVNTCFSM